MTLMARANSMVTLKELEHEKHVRREEITQKEISRISQVYDDYLEKARKAKAKCCNSPDPIPNIFVKEN